MCVAAATHRHVRFAAPNFLLPSQVPVNLPGEDGPFAAHGTPRSQLDHRVRQRNQVEHVPKPPAQKVPIQSRHDDRLCIVVRRPRAELHQVLPEKLGLVNCHDTTGSIPLRDGRGRGPVALALAAAAIHARKHVTDQMRYRKTRHLYARMRGDVRFAVSVVLAALQVEDIIALVGRDVLRFLEQFARLARKHGADDQMDGTSRPRRRRR
mmetsp:Transcript_14584/g.41548  ORF Transcript_14584/g.41548 Transcript_14584/m.41548 type:complete len:209 (-) Transcript_14584:252-878(-)